MKQKSGLCIHLKKSGEQVDLIRPLKKEACFHPKLDLVLYFGTPFQTNFFRYSRIQMSLFLTGQKYPHFSAGKKKAA